LSRRARSRRSYDGGRARRPSPCVRPFVYCPAGSGEARATTDNSLC
jgi:hypothetical protein